MQSYHKDQLVVRSRFTAATALQGFVILSQPLVNVVAYEINHVSISTPALPLLVAEGGLIRLESKILSSLHSNSVNFHELSTVDGGGVGVSNVRSNVILCFEQASIFSESTRLKSSLPGQLYKLNGAKTVDQFDWNLRADATINTGADYTVELIITFFSTRSIVF